MEWVIGAAVAAAPFAIILIAAIVAMATRRNNVANADRKNCAARKGANDEEVLLI